MITHMYIYIHAIIINIASYIMIIISVFVYVCPENDTLINYFLVAIE